MPSRRSYLAGVATLCSGLAGCTNPGSDASSPTDTPTESSGTEPKGSPSVTETPSDASKRTVGGATVHVTGIVARKAVTYESSMGSGGVLTPEGRQYVVASVQADADLSFEDFSVHAGGEQWSAELSNAELADQYAVAGHSGGAIGSLVASEGEGFVAFDLPSPLDAWDPAIHLEHGGDTAEWSLPDDATQTLGEPEPTFELDSLSVPDSVKQGDPLDVELTVTNTSDTEGRFLAAAYWPTGVIEDDDESHVVAETVAAGATVTQSLAIDTQYTSYEDGPVPLRVRGHVTTETTVEVTNAGTPP